MGATFSQFFPPSPILTEANLSSQQGKVFIVTGGSSGIGYELCRILYEAGGTVYLAGRSESNATDAIQRIKEIALSSRTPGELRFLHVALDDLSTIKPAVEKFTAAESRLDVLFNNAGVSCPPKGSVSTQGHELQLATNCLGPYLLTQLLLPTLRKTARDSPPATVRVIWTSSIAVDFGAPKNGLDIARISDPPSSQQENYAISKAGNWFLASQLASQAADDGILSVTANPGNLKSNLTRHLPRVVTILAYPLLYQPVYGAYTELWAGISSELSMKDGGNYIVPWGRVHPNPRPDLVAALVDEEDDGTGVARAFAQWCERQTVAFA
ncbi:putative steroid dehydrogenase [Aaosphaeria arxii CBS 175.79]|uniref:Putative steroid dehydrogenase n=1 Tax=Aaosphaeria arxii CBS 175.79 TaxID=1450172 RepID=A0A6A5XLK2_9PLEO|nr:putative steroid dehydrogenase [Aaosphaeria arxii CBS 175.79]KAF2013823.1 putative steroid dehydrogenase [Aaosphaeria arxii CBS 175.79]